VLLALGDHLGLHPLARAFAALAVSLFISWLMYRFVEKPCAELRRRLTLAG
jgi:peptidoglycan/LPS O-acetylase OafA/YrhL